MEHPLLLLCDAASMLEKQDASASQKQSPVTEETHGKANGTVFARKFKETYQAKVKIATDIDFKPYLPKLPKHRFADYIENTSDELSKRFSFKCRYSPDTCSEVVESYGSEVRAWTEIKQHVNNHHIAKSLNDLMCINQFTSTSKSSKSSSSVKTRRIISEGGSKRRKSVKQKSTDKEKSVHAPLETYFEVDNSKDFNDTTETLKLGQFEHDYAKREKEPSIRSPPVRHNKIQRWKLDLDTLDLLRELERRFKDEPSSTPAVIPTAPFPFVHTPEPPEPAQIVELHSNGDPVDYIGQIFVQSSTKGISTKKVVENEMSRKKSKSARVVSAPRSVLECVENRVACKPSGLSEQRDALEADNNIENSENVEKSTREIALRNIRMLSQQRRRRKNQDKQSDFICELCKKRFTANTSLTHHYMGHLKMKPFKCHICSDAFTRRHSLKYHLMIHANKNRFQCPICKRLFRHPSHYKEHLRKHTGEEPFSCKFCTNKFKTRNSFKRHLKMQHQKILTSNGIISIHNNS